jgi:hypothetical protein
MAELLIKARDATHPDQEIDRAGCYKRGDIVVVQPDGHVWGAKEGLPNFVKLKIPGLDPEIVRELIEPQDDDDDGNPHYEAGTAILVDGPVRKTFRRRRWRLMVAGISATLRNKLLNDGELTATKAQIRAHIKRVRNNEQFPKL